MSEASSSNMTGSAAAKRRFEIENNIQTVNPDAVYSLNTEAHEAACASRLWTKDPHYFKEVKIAATALIKMVMHAKTGGNIEVMGLMQGRVEGHSFIVMDSFALPVTGTETRVNVGEEGEVYMTEYLSLISRVGRVENAIGWYHSHPGFGCWLSGIDVGTQYSYQQYSDPWVAIVVDPKRTTSAGKVEIGAFRVYPENYIPPDAPVSEYQPIPSNKIADFGVHCKRYYPLDVTIFKSSLDSHLLDLLWNKYWVNTLSSSPILVNRDFSAGQIHDLAEKLEQAETQVAQSTRVFGGIYLPEKKKKKEESQLTKLYKDCSHSTIERVSGMMGLVIKNILFNEVKSVANIEPTPSYSNIPIFDHSVTTPSTGMDTSQ